MKRPIFSAVLLSSALVVSGALAGPKDPLPQLPGANATPSTTPPDADTLRKGVVQIETSGKPMAVGTVLSKDGRVLTSLSALGATTEPEIRYADGSVVKAKIGHKDKAWDLALLVPQTGRWLEGLVPTDADPSNGELKSFLPKNGKLSQTGVGYKGRVDAKSKDGDALKQAIDIDLKGASSVAGAPVLDPNGKVVGVLVKACKDQEAGKDGKAPPCKDLTVGAPIYALKAFLVKTPKEAALPAPWLGLGGASTESGSVKGVRVMGISAGSPAEKAGLKAGDAPDTIVAVDGSPVETPEQLAEQIAKKGIGQAVKLLVYSGGKFRDVPVTLRAAP